MTNKELQTKVDAEFPPGDETLGHITYSYNATQRAKGHAFIEGYRFANTEHAALTKALQRIKAKIIQRNSTIADVVAMYDVEIYNIADEALKKQK